MNAQIHVQSSTKKANNLTMIPVTMMATVQSAQKETVSTLNVASAAATS